MQLKHPLKHKAYEVLKLLGDNGSDAELNIVYAERGADCIPDLRLGNRRLQFVKDDAKGWTGGDISGHIMYGGDNNWRVHCYGSFAPSSDQTQKVAEYLLNPQTPPPSIQESIDKIVDGLVAEGIDRGDIAIDWSK